MNFSTLTIVGVGLIGGSIAAGAKRNGLAQRVRGIGRNQGTLDRALELKLIDEASTRLEDAAPESDLIILCTPVDRIAEQALLLGKNAQPGTLLTDAGSTKETIVRAVEGRLPPGVHFVGSHPLAGSEKKGPEYANPNLFQNRWTILTPTERTNQEALEKISDFWTGLGARVRTMGPYEHDRALARTSHLPHLLASALAGILPKEWKDLTATGFRDTTRIAAGDAEIWSAIFRHNRSALLDSLRVLEDQLQTYRRVLEADDPARLTELLDQAKKVRDALGS